MVLNIGVRDLIYEIGKQYKLREELRMLLKGRINTKVVNRKSYANNIRLRLHEVDLKLDDLRRQL